MAQLQASDICMQFGGVRAVHHVDLAVEQGEILGIIGPNGSGKTTLFNVMTGIYKPTQGKFIFQEKDITGWLPNRISNVGIARTFQNIRVFKNMSVLDNVLVGEHSQLSATMLGVLTRSKDQKKDEENARKRGMELIEFVKLTDRQKEYAANLAYGEQRRLEIARALATRPRLLLLDEPTAGMNPSEAQQVIDLIHEISNLGVTIILIEHNMQVMMGTARRIIAFNAGSKIAEGTPREIQYNEQVIKAYLGEEE